MQKLREAKELRSAKINKIEELKSIKTPLSVYEKLDNILACGSQNIEDADADFYLKCFGLFLKENGTFMLRVRVPAGQLSPTQAIKIGEISKLYAHNLIDITTRQQFELRHIQAENVISVLNALESVGITTFQTGIDNFRNIVTSSFDGLGDKNIIECKPIIDALQDIFLKKEEYLGVLPRKFNTAVLGTNINDCNIYGHDCSFIVAKKEEVIGFNLYLGGKVGVQAQDSGLFVKKEDVLITFKAVIDLFKTYGFRDNRNKNRLHFLLEAVGMEAFAQAIAKTTNIVYAKSGEILACGEYILDESGVFALSQMQSAYHLSIPSGLLSGEDLVQIATLTDLVDGTIRLSVEQSLYIIANNPHAKTILNSEIYQLFAPYQNIYFNHQIACVGSVNCNFGVIPSKSAAIEMAEFLSKEVPIKNAKVRMYWSGCVKGCGIHSIADIGFEGCKAKDENANSCQGVHIFLGGYATKKAAEARAIYKAVPLPHAKVIVKNIMLMYKNERTENESFESFYEKSLEYLSVAEIVERVALYA